MKNSIFQLFILTILCFLFGSAISAQSQTTTYYGDQSGNSGNYNSFFGYQAGMNTVYGHNTFIGSETGINNTTGHSCTFVGSRSGKDNSTGFANTFIGRSSGRYNTTGHSNAFVGYQTGLYNTTGLQNVILGSNAGFSHTTGNQNVYLGCRAGYSNKTGNRNIFIGFQAGYYETGDNKLYISGESAQPLIYGDFAKNQLAIGTRDKYIPAGFTLAVDGKMIAEEVKVRLRADWPDYVFEENYNKPTLEELEASIVENGHLPNIPSAATVEAEGYFLGEMNVKLLEKIEELTLYVIELNKGYKNLQTENETLKAKVKVNSLIISETKK